MSTSHVAGGGPAAPGAPRESTTHMSRAIRRATAEGALTLSVYAVVEVAFVAIIGWLAGDRAAYHPVHPAFRAVRMLLYPVLGAIAGALIAVLTRGRIVRTGASLCLALGLAAYVLIEGKWLRWTAPLVALGLGIALLLLIFEFSRRWAPRLRWVANPWWVAGMLAGVPFVEREIVASMGHVSRLLWPVATALAITLLSVLFTLVRREAPPLRRRAYVVAAASVVVFAVSLFMEPSIRSLPPLAGRDPGNRPNVIIVVLDTVRADHLSVYGYERDTTPNLVRFAADAVKFKHAVAPSDMTLPSHASLFTGLYPSRHGAHFSPVYRWGRPLETSSPTLAESLRDKGYMTAGVVANTGYLQPNFQCDRGFLYYDARWPASFLVELRGAWLRQSLVFALEQILPARRFRQEYHDARSITDSALQEFERARSTRRPVFLFMNYMDAHFPRLTPDPYFDKFPGRISDFSPERYRKLREDVLRFKRQVTPAEREELHAEYDSGIAYIDAELGRFFNALKQSGQYDDALIVVTSDHGEAFGEKNYVDHAGLGTYQFLVNVPLMIKYPHSQHKGTVDYPVSLVDVMPTALEVIGYQSPTGLDGQSLLRSEPPSRVLSEVFPGLETQDIAPRYHREQRAIYSGALKYQEASDGTRELYDLAQDPGESNNLYATEGARVAKLEADLHGWMASAVPPPDKGNAAAARTQVDRLRSLGYVQ